jgi:hypothetical protein
MMIRWCVPHQRFRSYLFFLSLPLMHLAVMIRIGSDAHALFHSKKWASDRHRRQSFHVSKHVDSLMSLQPQSHDRCPKGLFSSLKLIVMYGSWIHGTHDVCDTFHIFRDPERPLLFPWPLRSTIWFGNKESHVRSNKHLCTRVADLSWSLILCCSNNNN